MLTVRLWSIARRHCRPVKTKGSAHAASTSGSCRGRVPHRPAARRGRTRLRARARGSGERRRHRPGCPYWGRCLRQGGGGATGIRTRPRHAYGALAPLHGAVRAAHPAPQAMGRESTADRALHMHGVAPRVSRPSSANSTHWQIGPGRRADPGAGHGGARPTGSSGALTLRPSALTIWPFTCALPAAR